MVITTVILYRVEYYFNYRQRARLFSDLFTLVALAVEDDPQTWHHPTRLPSKEALVRISPAIGPAHRNEVFAAKFRAHAPGTSLVVQTTYFGFFA